MATNYSKFPNPPKFKNGLGKENFEVPKYYGFDHPCTKWILGSIVSNQALFRLMKVATSYSCILKRYHQIPDSPSLIMKDQYNTERAAFDKQAILYLTPFAISIYMKYEDALTQLVGLKDSNGNTTIDPNDLCFVQNFWRKGETRYFTDLISTYPAIIAIRRNFFSGFRFLLMAGYCPNDSFYITYRKPHREIIIFYRDLIDYVIDYLKRRPAFNVSMLMNVLLQPAIGSINNLDIFSFDIFPDATPNLISIFHRITKNVLEEENLSEESGMHLINILEKIQEAGFFLGLRVSNQKSNMYSDLGQLITEKKTNKVKSEDLQKLNEEQLNNLLNSDYNYCISNIIIWLQTKSLKRKTEQSVHLLKLLVKIMFETKLIEIFFKENSPTNEKLFERLCELPYLEGNLEMKTVITIMNYVLQIYQQSEIMITAFISQYKSEPIDILLGYSVNKAKSKDSNKNNWIKTELADQKFRSKYLKGKSDLNKKCLDLNKSNSVDNKLKIQPVSFKSTSSGLQIENTKNQNNQLSKKSINSGDHICYSSKSMHYRSLSTNYYQRRNNRRRDDSTIDLTIGSAKSLAALDPNDTVSISNMFDLNNLTTIEIDLAELRKTKRMFSEVMIAEWEDEGYRKIPIIPDIISSSTCLSNTLRNSEKAPPPLKENLIKHYKVK